MTIMETHCTDWEKWDIKLLATDPWRSDHPSRDAQRRLLPADRVKVSTRTPREILSPNRGGVSGARVPGSSRTRQVITSSKFNLMQDLPMPGPLDAISAALVIYFDRTSTRALREDRETSAAGRLLFLGHSETCSKGSDGVCVDRQKPSIGGT